MLNQQLHNLQMPLLGGNMQRSAVSWSRRVDNLIPVRL